MLTRAFRSLLLAALCLFFIAGCLSRISGSDSGSSASTTASRGAPLPRFFTPLETGDTIELTAQQAREAARLLVPASQGLRSWKDLTFPVDQSLSAIAGKTGSALARPGLTVTWEDLAAGLALLKSLLPRLDADPTLLASSFRWVRLGPDFEFTGYYEPTLQARRRPEKGLAYPLYRVPPDLKKNLPYHDRAAIDRKGVLTGKGLEIAYVDETDAYFLHVQGSGRLSFPDGTSTHVLYAGKNNREYVSLARVMREEGLLPEGGSSMKAIRGYLAANPHERSRLFDQNPSYVFFREAERGPIGGMGRPLTPYVSTAVDRRILPYGALTMVSLPLPDRDGKPAIPFHALTLPQDTGGAIKGHRIDLFCGPGDIAAHIAGHLDANGAVYLLLPRR